MKPGVDLSEEQVREVRRILSDVLPGRKVRVFGSRSSGSAKAWSDLDLLVMDGGVPIEAMAAVRDAFAESDLPFRVDVVDASALDEGLLAAWLAGSAPIV